MSDYAEKNAHDSEVDEILELARQAGLLITLDGQIGRQKYQSVAGSVNALLRFVEALRADIAEKEAA